MRADKPFPTLLPRYFLRHSSGASFVFPPYLAHTLSLTTLHTHTQTHKQQPVRSHTSVSLYTFSLSGMSPHSLHHPLLRLAPKQSWYFPHLHTLPRTSHTQVFLIPSPYIISPPIHSLFYTNTQVRRAHPLSPMPSQPTPTAVAITLLCPDAGVMDA